MKDPRPGALPRQLLAAARSQPVDERVPAGFVRRVQRELERAARPAAAAVADAWTDWSRGLWQALIPALGCLAVVLWFPGRGPGASPEFSGTPLTDDEAAEITLWHTLDSTADPEGEL